MRRGLPDTTTTYRWTVGGAPSPTRPAVVSTAPLGPRLRQAAGFLLALALIGAGLLALAVRLLGRRAPGRPGPRPAPDPVQSGCRPDLARLQGAVATASPRATPMTRRGHHAESTSVGAAGTGAAGRRPE